jgi:Flp pilus assembly protein TadG
MIGLRHIIRSWRRFARNDQGTSTVEFVLVAPVLLSIFFWVFETGFIMTQQMMLERALDLTVREMRLSNDTTFTQEFITDAVCQKAKVFKNCAGVLQLELTPITTAADIPVTATTCVNRANTVKPVTNFNTGARGEIVYMRACIVVDPLLAKGAMGIGFTLDSTGGLRLVAETAFLNEPA